MADIFKKEIKVKAGPLGRAEQFVITATGTGGAGGGFIGLAQNVSLTYGQALQRIWELGSFDAYMINGRSQGSMQIGRVVGNDGKSSTFVDALGDKAFEVASTDGNSGLVITLLERVTKVKYVCTGCYVTQFSVGADANGSIITENVAIEFQSLSVE